MNEIEIFGKSNCWDWVDVGKTVYMGKTFHWMVAKFTNGNFAVILKSSDGWRVGVESQEIRMFPDCIPSYFFEYPVVSRGKLERIIQEALQ